MILNVGIVGIGFGQQVHVPAFRGHPDCAVAAICASRLERAEAVAARLDIPVAYGDWRALVADPRIDIVSIATRPGLQAEVALEAIAHGKSVFAEKPLSASTEQALAMTEAARAHGVAHMVNFEFPELPVWKRARQLLTEGALGRLRHVTTSWHVETYSCRKQLQSWKNNPAEGGGVLNMFLSHTLYNLEWLCGEKVKGLSAHVAAHRIADPAAETYASLSLEMESGLPVNVDVSSHAFGGSGHRWAFHGDDGVLMIINESKDYMDGFALFYASRSMDRLERQDVAAAKPDPTDDGRIAPVQSLAGKLLAWHRNGTAAQPSFAEGLRVQHLLNAARASQASRQWVWALSETQVKE